MIELIIKCSLVFHKKEWIIYLCKIHIYHVKSILTFSDVTSVFSDSYISFWPLLH